MKVLLLQADRSPREGKETDKATVIETTHQAM